MKTYKPFLILTLMIWSSFASAAWIDIPGVNCIGKNEPLAPTNRHYTDSNGNSHETDEFKNWKDEYGGRRKDFDCCNKLEANAARVCQDTSMVDETIRVCTNNHNECADLPGGLGCLPMSEDDMFSTNSEDQAVIDAMNEKEKKFEEQQAKILMGNDPIETGSSRICFANMQCESYNCHKFKCAAPINICRLAVLEDNPTPPSVNCEEPFIKKNGKCTDGSVPFYNGLLGNIIVGPKIPKPGDPPATRCEFGLYPDGKDSDNKPLTTDHIEGAVNLAIRTVRSLEWLYSTVSNDDNKDCLFTREYMKKEINILVEERKEILKEYNVDIQDVEKNFEIISKVELDSKDETQIPTLCLHPSGGYEQTTKHDIASRKATGLDFLCYMKERNAVYQTYELKMLQLTEKLDVIITAYNNTVFTWSADNKHDFTTGNKTHQWRDRDCRDWPKWHKKIKKRWTERYKVFGRRDRNKAAVDQPRVTEYLSYIGDQASVSEFKKNYYLLDPLMPGGQNKGVSFKDYGRRRNFNGDDDRSLGIGLSTVLGGIATTALTGGLGAATYIASTVGADRGHLIDMYLEWEPRLIEYLHSLNKGLPAGTFIHEPEIRGSYEMRGCMESYLKPGTVKDEGANIAKCVKFKEYIDDLKDFAFAQFLAYSKHNKKKYKYFFLSKGSWRR
ncbi:MAG: hypothetical protein H0V66_03970, partial [Bdellovibrionales bacterium]|nr:hypothetical protein [Bdellovibrionales bacterium]